MAKRKEDDEEDSDSDVEESDANEKGYIPREVDEEEDDDNVSGKLVRRNEEDEEGGDEKDDGATTEDPVERVDDDEEEDDDDDFPKMPTKKTTFYDSDSASPVAKKKDDDEEDEESDSASDEEEGDDESKKQSDQEEVDEEDDDNVITKEPVEDDDDEDDRLSRPQKNTTLYDFDIMMAKKKEENSRKRKRRNYDIINDNDDIIADIINQMKDAVEADSEANKNKMAATRKLKLLPFVISQLRKVDLRDAFLDSDVLSVITEWLAPLPDRSLPHLNIRDSLLKILIDFNLYDVDRIKTSGIGKAIMYLYKHPKETKENKQRAKQLISCWSRPIFQLDSSFNSISREEREQRDLDLMSKQRRASKQHDSSDGEGPGPSSGHKKTKEDVAQKPGDKGWIPRARVPAPSMRDYVVRPRSKVDGDVGKSSKRPANMLEKYIKSQHERRRANRQQRAINMKIDRV